MSCYITFKKTLTYGSQVFHMWVTSGLFCGLEGEMGQQVRPTFNPDIYATMMQIMLTIFSKTALYLQLLW